MAKQRSTFGKIQREQEKRQKAAAKRERRAARSSGEDVNEAADAETPAPASDQAAILDALARLYQQYEAGELETDDFELRRDELRRQIDLG